LAQNTMLWFAPDTMPCTRGTVDFGARSDSSAPSETTHHSCRLRGSCGHNPRHGPSAGLPPCSESHHHSIFASSRMGRSRNRGSRESIGTHSVYLTTPLYMSSG
jgi:hypothetical protein